MSTQPPVNGAGGGAGTTDRLVPGHRETGTPGPTAAPPPDEAQAVAGLLRALYQYVSRNLPAHVSLAPAVAALYAPVQSYAGGNVGLAQAQAVAVYQLIMQLRGSEPGLPIP